MKYYNENADKYLESRVISDLVGEGDHLNSEYYGVVSYRFGAKTGRRSSQVFHWIEKDSYEHDVYGFRANWTTSNIVNLFKQGDRWHPNFSKVATELFKRLDMPCMEQVQPPIFYNYWICKSELVERFVKEMLNPAMEVLETMDLAYENSEYRVPTPEGKDQLTKVFGRPYYTYHPFICERLFPAWVTMNKLKYKFI